MANSRSDKVNRIIRYVMTMLLLIIVILYIFGQFFLKHASFSDNFCFDFPEKWIYTDKEGTVHEYSYGDVFPVELNEDLIIETRLPDDVRDDACFYYKSGKDFSVYIDGELRGDYNITYSELGRTVKAMYIPVRLSSADSGKKLTIVKEKYVFDHGTIYDSYIANGVGFVSHMLTDNMLILILAFALVILGSMILIICLAYRFFKRNEFPLWYLSLGVVLGAIWIILDNYTYPFFFNNAYIDGICGYLIVFILPFPFISYLNLLQERRYQKDFNVVNMMLIINFLTMSVLNFADIADFSITMRYSMLVTVFAAIVCLSSIIYDRITQKSFKYPIISTGFALLTIMCVCEIIHVNLNSHKNDGFFMALGFLVLLICAVVFEIKRYGELRRKTTQAEESNKAKSEFLANMSHEIRTPINAIMGMDELILREDVSEEVRGYALNIQDASKNLLDIINDILDFSKIEQGKMEIIPDEYDTAELINSVLTMIRVKADEKQLKLIPEISVSLPGKLYGDQKRIREIMVNLLNNAVKYTPEGSIMFGVSSKQTDEKNISLNITIRDTGIGIKPEDMDKLFTQFERLDLKKTKGIEGSGLGLAITSSLVKLMDGTIKCESEYGVGTQFSVELPQTVIDETPIGEINEYSHARKKQAEKDKKDSFTFPGVRVLVVDDNALNQKVASRFLSAVEAVSVTASSGAQMLDIVTKERFDIILLDHMMPEIDGIETLARANKLSDNMNTGVPVIALTANAINGAREMYMEHGFTDYLSKPMSLEDLSAVMVRNLPSDKIVRHPA